MKNKKSYTWEEIKKFLEKELNESKHIMTWGTIGSCNIKRDIDTIITKKPKSKCSDFSKELHNILDNLNNYLNEKYGVNLIRVPNTSFTEEFMKLSNYSKGDLVLHIMVYSSYPQMEKDWKWALFKNENLNEIMKNNYDCIFGKVDDLFSRDFKKIFYADNIFLYVVSLYDRTNSNYSKKFLIQIMNGYFDFLYRKRLKLKAPVAKDKKEVRKYIYKLCDIIDKLNRKIS